MKLVCDCFLMLVCREKPVERGIHGEMAHARHARTMHGLCMTCLIEDRNLTDPA